MEDEAHHAYGFHVSGPRNVAGETSSTPVGQLFLLAWIWSGALMCKVVYDFFRFISPESVKQVVKEFEKEQRDEDAGTHSKGTQEQDQGQGKELQDVEQGKKQGQDVEQGTKQWQEQDSNTDVTFTDATKQEQPMETGQSETSENSKNEENGQQQQAEQNSGNEENGQQNEEMNTVSEENGKEEKSMKDENGQQEEHNTAEDERGNKEEQSTTKDENMEQQEERKDEKKQEGSEASGFGSIICWFFSRREL